MQRSDFNMSYSIIGVEKLKLEQTQQVFKNHVQRENINYENEDIDHSKTSKL